MNEHHKLDCGCMSKTVACRCDYRPHEPHEVIVSPCPKHIKQLGREVVGLAAANPQRRGRK